MNALARNSFGIADCEGAYSTLILLMLEQIHTLQEKCGALEAQIGASLQQFDTMLTTIPGIPCYMLPVQQHNIPHGKEKARAYRHCYQKIKVVILSSVLRNQSEAVPIDGVAGNLYHIGACRDRPP